MNFQTTSREKRDDIETYKLQTHLGDDGVLKFELPVDVPHGDYEVLVILQPIPQDKIERDALGWPIGFFERTFGALADDPMDRPPQP